MRRFNVRPVFASAAGLIIAAAGGCVLSESPNQGESPGKHLPLLPMAEMIEFAGAEPVELPDSVRYEFRN